MDTNETTNKNVCEPEANPPKAVTTVRMSASDVVEIEMLKKFLQLTGGSLFYCLSAVFVAYGIVKVMGPMLSEGEALKNALPCIFTLHAYELALLGVLVLIVSRKVVDDAISIVILQALFLIGTSIALGSVADKGISASFWLGLAGTVAAFGKFYVMRRFSRISFRTLSVIGLGGLITFNYLGPVLMARAMSVKPSDELARRGLWLLIWFAMLIWASFVIIEAIIGRPRQKTQQNNQVPFLQTPAMVYVFATILVIASGINQYSMAYAFVLERVIGDFVPITAVATLLGLEAFRHSGKRFGDMEIVISCAPLAVMMLAILQKSVLASGQFGLGLICYPPVILAFSGLAIVSLAVLHRQYRLLAVAFAYGLGVILTVGFSPRHPYVLNTNACVGTLVAALLVYGIIVWNERFCLAGIIILGVRLGMLNTFSEFLARSGLTMVGGLAGVFGLGSVFLYLLFGCRLHKAVQIFGTVCLAGFVFDYLPECANWRYIVALFGTGLLAAGLWLRTRDILAISILWAPFLIRLYIMAKYIAHWRFVILGFLLLGAGTVVSLLGRQARNQTDLKAETPEKHKGSFP